MKMFMLRRINAALVLMLLGAASMVADDATTTKSFDRYKLIMPELVRQGETFTGKVVEETSAGEVPFDGGQVLFQGQVIPIEPGGKIAFPAFTKEAGSALVVAQLMRSAGGNAASTLTRHVEVLPVAANLPERLAQASALLNPGGEVWGTGQGLQVIKAALVDQNGEEHALRDLVGSSLQVGGTAPSNLAPGTYHFVAWDAAGNRVEAPNTSRCPTLKLEGSRITRRGQRGGIVILSDTEGTVLLSGGEPQILLDERTVNVGKGKLAKVKFVAQQVGDYKVNARLFSVDVGPASDGALRVSTRLEPLQSRYDAASNQTQAKVNVDVMDDAGHAVANAPVDIALVHPNGVQYGRAFSDQQGRASLTQTLAGQVATDALSALVYGVPGHRWQQDNKECHCDKVRADMVPEMSDSQGNKRYYPAVDFDTGKNKEGKDTVTITVKVGVHWTLFCEPGRAPGGCKAEVALKADPKFSGGMQPKEADGSLLKVSCPEDCLNSPTEGHPDLTYKATFEGATLPIKGNLTLTLETKCENQPPQQQWKMILAIDSDEPSKYDWSKSDFNGDGTKNKDKNPDDGWKRPTPKPTKPSGK
jgi:hypothetical protein